MFIIRRTLDYTIQNLMCSVVSGIMHDSEIYEQNGMRFHGDGPANPRCLFRSMRLDN
jgi:hypothetical protein